MKIPTRIKIGEHKVDVYLVKSDILKDAGLFDFWFQTIKINIDDTKEDTQAEAFLHEIIEAISKFYELGLDHKTITTLSEVLFQVIRGNNLDFRDQSVL